MNKSLAVLLAFAVFCLANAKEGETVSVPTVFIENEEQTHLNEYQTFKSEFVSQQKLSDMTRHNLTDLIQDQPGVEAQVYCANCGAKRLTINGLKGEHTSILVDGIPLHSAISSFYGVDNIPTTGLSQVEVMRGTGASLTNPEAIGGTINLITTDPLTFEHKLNSAYGINDRVDIQSYNLSFATGLKGENKKWGIVAMGQGSLNNTWDEDGNFIAELPQRDIKSGMLKGRFLLGKNFDLSVRLGYSELEIIGGFHDPFKPSTVRENEANENDFVNGDVHNLFIGDPEKIMDWINVERSELGINLTNYLSSDLTLEVKGGIVNQQQTSIYQHGFDYANEDNLFVGDISLQYVTPSSNIWKLGIFQKIQNLRSASRKIFDTGIAQKDNFNYSSSALYLSNTLFLNKFEFDFALRADRIDIDWRELENRVTKTFLAPRFLALFNQTDHLTHRFSYGRGYRAPLTFFESQHGNNESGYEVDITDLEESHSLVYSLSYNKPKYYATFGSHFTYLENMAYGFEELQRPTKYRNYNEGLNVWVNDLLLGYKFSEKLLVEATFEKFDYQTRYKKLLPNTAIEERAIFRSTFTGDKWEQITTFTVVPSRDISAYGEYDNHFKNRVQSAEPFQSPRLVKKGQKAPTFATLDLGFAYKVKPKSKFTFAINNVFDYTQVKSGDSPATFHWHFVHGHFDGLHTWGPNAGRQFVMGYQHTF